MNIIKVKYAGLCFILFLISALLICSILGCSRDGMNNMEENKSTTISDNSSKIFIGQRFETDSGGSIEVISNTRINVSKNMGASPVSFTTTKPNDSNFNVEGFKELFTSETKTVFYGPNGETATVITNNGHAAIRVNYPDDTVYLYTNVDIDDDVNAVGATGPYGNSAYVAEGPEGEVVYGTTNGTPYYDNYNNNNNVNTASVTTATGPGGTTVGVATGPNGNTTAGISASQIPPGTEDLYILKSQVVPPVCPACPVASSCPRTEAPPPCPACARCPEPSFECKKVPNYNAADINMLPMPVLTDFTSFGM
jgi:hypothetical protein